MHISKKEQKRRYRAYQKDPLLRWKLTRDYARQNKRYARWAKAAEEMLERCNTAYAPWTLVEAEDPRWARIRVLETLVVRLEQVTKFPEPAVAPKRKAPAGARRKVIRKAAPAPAPAVEEQRAEVADAVERG
jgi:hypothetical protein